MLFKNPTLFYVIKNLKLRLKLLKKKTNKLKKSKFYKVLNIYKAKKIIPLHINKI